MRRERVGKKKEKTKKEENNGSKEDSREIEYLR